MKYPEIRIKDAWLLRENASRHLHELWAEKGEMLSDDKWMEWKVGEYKKAWKPYEKKILHGMCQAAGLEFRQNIIDVYIAPWFGAFSEPLIVGVMSKPDRFIDILTHELIHRLLTDNTIIYDYDQPGRLWAQYQKTFGAEHSFNMVIEMVAQAVHKAVYLDVLKAPERLKRDIEGCKAVDAVNHIRAWEYIEEHGYKEIIEKLKAGYAELQV